jgi:alkylhydroperoxidase family enzyme
MKAIMQARMANAALSVPGAFDTAEHFEEPALASLILHITLINAWNRLNATTRLMAHAW